MPIEVIAGSALGVVFQLLVEAIKRAKDRSLTTESIFDRLDATTSRITPLVVKLSEVDDSSRRIIEEFELLLVKAVSLVDAYAELRRRNLLEKYRYKRRIKDLEVSLRSMVDIDFQVNQLLDIKELMAKMSEMNTKLDEITRQPTDCPCFKCNRTISQSSNPSVVENDESSSDGSKPKIDFYFRWSSSRREFRFTLN